MKIYSFAILVLCGVVILQGVIGIYKGRTIEKWEKLYNDTTDDYRTCIEDKANLLNQLQETKDAMEKLQCDCTEQAIVEPNDDMLRIMPYLMRSKKKL